MREPADSLITVATFSQAVEAHIAKGRLEAEGIDCFIADENIVNMNWLYSNAVGGVKLRVREPDVKRALEIMKPGAVEAETTAKVIGDEVGVRCPKCNSDDVYYEKYSKGLFFWSWLLVGVPLPFLRRKWRCTKCGYHWKAKK
jgi:DNA-directed RNA polymerase subunit M/transcription elongation factor TFIIS